MRYHEEYGVYYLGDGDPYVYTEQKRDYSRVASRAEGVNVLDFGAHCGFFNIFISQYKPSKIVSVEPDPKLIPVLRKNAKKGSTIINAAVVDKSSKKTSVDLYLGKTFSATNSLEPFKGREKIAVSAVKFQELLEQHEIKFLKCDCEGGEMSLDWRKLPKRLSTICIEFHFHRPAWSTRMEEIHQELLNQKFKAVKTPKVNNFQKVSIGLYERN